MTRGIGAPTVWHDYSGLVLRRDDLFGNWMRAVAFESADVARAAAGTQSRTWVRPPQTVNAYYAPATNEIVVPAALLQSPIFDADGDYARNYGALGALAGHEIAHASARTRTRRTRSVSPSRCGHITHRARTRLLPSSTG